MSSLNASPFGAIRGPIVDPKTGKISPDFFREIRIWKTKLDNLANLVGEIRAEVNINGRTEGVGTTTQNLDVLGQAAPGMVVTRSVNPGILSHGLIQGQGRNGDSVTFASAFDTVPIVNVYPTNTLLFNVADVASNQYARYEALEVTKTGFVIKAALLVDDFTVTARSVVPSGVVAIKNLAAEAYDDQYVFQYDVTVAATGSRGLSLVTLGFWERANGGTFTLRATATWSNSDVSNPSVLTNKTKAITIDGAGNNHEFTITVESQIGNGGTLDSFDSLSWNEPDSGVTERDATPDASDYVTWTAVEGSSE